MLRRRSAVLALCVFGVGFALVWAGFFPPDDPFQFCPDAPQIEGSGIRAEPALWPPGTTRCEYTTPSGSSSSRTYAPWNAWLALMLFAAGVGVAASAPSRLLRLGLAFGLILAAGAALFGVLGV